MAQKIVTLCDVHQRNDEERAGVAWELTMTGPDNSRPITWEVDLCDDDGKMLRDLATMLDQVGRRTGGTKASAARTATASPKVHTSGPAPVESRHTAEGWPCPMDGCDKAPQTRAGLMSHLRTQHDGISLAEATGQPLPYACPECDRKFSHPTGLGAHRRAAHGVKSGQHRAGA